MIPNADSNTARSGVVLIAEDEKGLADLYGAWLTGNHEVRTAYDGREAIDLLDGEIDIALIDRRMPNVVGDEVAEEIQKAGFDCQVALVTGVTADLEIADLPIDEYLTKPVDQETLVKTVEELFIRAEASSEKKHFLALKSRKQAIDAGNPDAGSTGQKAYKELEDRIDKAADRLGVEITTNPNTQLVEKCPSCVQDWGFSEDRSVGFIELGENIVNCLSCGEIHHHGIANLEETQ